MKIIKMLIILLCADLTEIFLQKKELTVAIKSPACSFLSMILAVVDIIIPVVVQISIVSSGPKEGPQSMRRLHNILLVHDKSP